MPWDRPVLPAIFRRLLRNDRGTIMVLTAISLTVLIGFIGLGVETGLWYAVKRHDQSAADLAALSGAMEIAQESSPVYYQSSNGSGICGLSRRDAARGGFTFAAFTCPNASPGCTNPASGQMCANNPPVLGASAGDPNAVEVILAQQQNTFFASLFLPSVTIDTRAVAKVSVVGSGCTLGLGKTGTDINFSGNSTIDMNGCSIISNSPSPKSINLQGNTSLTAAALLGAGNINVNGNSLALNVPTEVTDMAPVRDPYSCNPPQLGCAGTITWPTVSGAEMTAPTSGGTLLPGLYSAPMSFTSGTTIMCPGVYVIDGEDNQDEAFAVSGSSTIVQMGTAGSGVCPNNGINGVTIIATSTGTTKKGGGFVITAGTVELSAPTTSPQTGIPSGLLFVQDPNHADTKPNGNGNEADSTITANGNTSLTGVLYTPATNVTFIGNSNSSCFIIIALTITFNGNSTMSGNPTACAGDGITGPSVLNVALSE